MFLIELFFLVLFFLFWKVLSKTFGNIGEHFYGEKGKKIGRLIPLMLFCSLIAYQIIEYVYIRHQVQNLCKKEAGIFVYVTPEQWKEENKGKLDNLYQFDNIKPKDGEKYNETKKKKREIEEQYKFFVYDNNKYKVSHIYNKRIVGYSTYKKLNYFVTKSTALLVDINTNKVLMKRIYINSGVSGFMSIDHLTDLKYWMNTIPNCLHLVFDYPNIERQFSNPSLNKGIENDK